MKQNFFLTLAFSFILGCNNKQGKEEISENDWAFKTLITEDEENISIKDFLNFHSIVNLETRKEAFVGEIDRVLVEDSLIYILDKNQRNAVIIFRQNGDFVNVIDNQGRGPHEYVNLQDIAYYNNSLHLLDRAGKKILNYSPTGDFLTTSKLDDNYMSFNFMKPNKLLLYSSLSSSSRKKFSINDTTGKVITKFFDISKNQESVHDDYNISTINDKIFFATPYQNKIYTIEEESPKIIFELDFQGRFLEKEFRVLPYQIIRDRVMGSQGEIITGIDNLVFTEDVFYFNYAYKHSVRSAFVEYPSGKLLDAGILTSNAENPFINFQPVGRYNKGLIFKLNPELEYERYKRLKKIPEYQEFLHLYDSAFENMEKSSREVKNPSLIFYQL